MGYYSEPYVEFDEYGMKEVRCMRCNMPVASRTYVKVKGENVLALRRLGNWRQIKMELNNGTYCTPILCNVCSTCILDLEEVLKQIKRGWELELRAANHPEEAIALHKEKVASLAPYGG